MTPIKVQHSSHFDPDIFACHELNEKATLKNSLKQQNFPFQAYRYKYSKFTDLSTEDISNINESLLLKFQHFVKYFISFHSKNKTPGGRQIRSDLFEFIIQKKLFDL